MESSSNLAKLSNEIDFTINILEPGNPEIIVEEGEWFEFECKLMFDKSIIKTIVHSSDQLIGFDANSDTFTLVRQRSGYFNSQICKILHRCIQLMRLNERSEISFELNPLLLNESFQSKVLENKKCYLDLKFEIFLKNIEKLESQPIYSLSRNKLIVLSNEHKSEANELFKNSLYLTAFQRYHKSISYLIIAEQEEKQENDPEIDLKKMKSQLYSNFAACQLKNSNYKMAIINCTKCLEIDGNNVKAFFRRATAYAGIKEYESAISDCQTAISIDSNNIEVKKKLNQIEALQKQYNQNMSAKFKKMFE